jgi:hypothetical protein
LLCRESNILGAEHLKKLRRAEGGAKIFGVFRVKNHDFTPKKNIFLILGGVREIFGVFYVKNHDFTTKKIIFLPILGVLDLFLIYSLFFCFFYH